MPAPLLAAGARVGGRYAVRGLTALAQRRGRSLSARGRIGGRPGAVPGVRRKGRRSLFMSKGRLFMAFSAKEVKNALRRKYGGRKGRSRA